MYKKNLKMVLGSIVLGALLIGCGGSGNDNQQNCPRKALRAERKALNMAFAQNKVVDFKITLEKMAPGLIGEGSISEGTNKIAGVMTEDLSAAPKAVTLLNGARQSKKLTQNQVTTLNTMVQDMTTDGVNKLEISGTVKQIVNTNNKEVTITAAKLDGAATDAPGIAALNGDNHLKAVLLQRINRLLGVK